MANLTSNLVTFMAAVGGLSTIASKIYPLRAPDNATDPYAVYQVISDPRHNSHSGSSGYGVARIQVRFWSTSYDTAKTLCEALIAAADGYKGSFGTTPRVVIDVADGPDDWNEKTRRYAATVDLIIAHQAAA